MYKLSIEKLDGTRIQRQGTYTDLATQVSNTPDIQEYWIEDEAGNVVVHWAHTDNEDYDEGQPTEYEEWQDYMGGDDWDHGQYDDGGF